VSTAITLLGSWLLVNVLIVLFGLLVFGVIPAVSHRLRAKVRTVVLIRDIERDTR
jgi:uncharacterized membrane protein YesL